MSRRLRVLFLALLTVSVTLGWTRPAQADSDPTVTIGDLKNAGSGYQGVLTFRAQQVVQVDPKSVKATIDGKPVPISVRGTSHLQRTALLVIDTSGSMGTIGMQTVRAATAVYLKEVPSDVRVGVLRFASRPQLVLKPTTDRAAAQRAVDGLRPGGETALYGGIQQATRVLGTKGDRGIVLLSDGADTESEHPATDLAADTTNLKRSGVRVDVVRFKNTDPSAERALAKFAAAGGGSDVLATNAAGVAAAFRTSAQALNSQAQFTLTPLAPLAGTHRLSIAGTAARRSFTVAQSLGFGAASRNTAATPSSAAVANPPPPTTNEVDRPSRTWIPWVGGALLIIAIFLAAFVLLTPSLRSRRELRLATVQSYLNAATRKPKRATEQGAPSSLRTSIADVGERILAGRTSEAATVQLLQRADLPLRPGEWLALKVLAVVFGALAGALLFGGAMLFGLMVGAIAGLATPALFLRFKASRRTGSFEKQLPQVLALVATSLRSGFGLPQALDAVARDAADPAAKEFSRALAQVRIGSDIADALDDLAARMGTQTLHMTVMAIRIQRQVGGNLAETLDTTAHTLRERESLRGQVAALSAEGRLSAWILIALPVSIFLYMTWVDYSYVALLWNTFMGLVVLIGTCVLMVIGVFWMRKTVQIEV